MFKTQAAFHKEYIGKQRKDYLLKRKHNFVQMLISRRSRGFTFKYFKVRPEMFVIASKHKQADQPLNNTRITALYFLFVVDIEILTFLYMPL